MTKQDDDDKKKQKDPYKKLENLYLHPETGANKIRSVEDVCKDILGKNTHDFCEKTKDMMRVLRNKVNDKLKDDDVSLFEGGQIMMCTVLKKDVSHRGNNEIYGWVLHDSIDSECFSKDINDIPCYINELARDLKRTNKKLEGLKGTAKASEASGGLPEGTTDKIPDSVGFDIDPNDYSEVDVPLIEELKKLSFRDFRIRLDLLSRMPLNIETKKQINEMIKLKKEEENKRIEDGLDEFNVE